MLIRVLHVVGIMNKGGIETFVLNVVCHMDRNHIVSEILCTMPGTGAYEPELDELGIPVHKIGEEFSSYEGKLRYIGQYRTYKKWFDEHEYDVVHVHGSHAFDLSIAVQAIADSKYKSAIIVHSHTASGDHVFLEKVFAKHLSHAPIVRLSCSKPAAQWMFGSQASYRLIKNGIDAEAFRYDNVKRSEIRKELGISSSDRVIVHVGRLVPVKNHPFLIDVLLYMLDKGIPVKMVFVGDGPDREQLERRTKELGISDSVLFLGSRADVPAILSASDAFAMPSYHEGLPLAAVEAQASGLPTLLSANVADEAAFTDLAEFLPIDEGIGPWVKRLNSIFQDSVSRQGQRQEAVDSVKQAGFDIETTVKQLSSIYRHLLGEKQLEREDGGYKNEYVPDECTGNTVLHREKRSRMETLKRIKAVGSDTPTAGNR